MVWPFMLFGGWLIIVWIVIIGLIVWGVIALTRYAGKGAGGGQRRDPLEILKERYARGEISREEFEQIKKDLS
jgi:putative membrane protein